ncbi:DEAD/DEAH box helicase [Rhodococcus sp. 06-1460-1B]|uniref:DEAD/DEAH box helicase n=1 Tax=Rhodococcus sp. 06-1460-1B TaxID=2022501 RepID=UPI000B9AB57B|nr:DEAD/DEAH box helicase family protein [Rhodococcus sp. 06-1460-1B]OZD53576.1 hypothetical protein CH268_27175 [Rhodococcus sp. 06-1460-1B]
MIRNLAVGYRPELIEDIGARFALRRHNIDALGVLVKTLSGEYDPLVQQVLNMATGSGKTYLMAAFIEYLRHEGVQKVVIVTPGLVVQEKTVANFAPGHRRYIPGALVSPLVATPTDLSAMTTNLAMMGQDPMRLYVFNVQQLIAPISLEGNTKNGTASAVQRGLRKDNEVHGNVFTELKNSQNLVLIADESHLYGASATAFNAALRELEPAAAIGLTASASKVDHVIYNYPLYQAIEDRNVKIPVLAFRNSGYGDTDTADQLAVAEERQLRDAMNLLAIKELAYSQWASKTGVPAVSPVLFVVCSDTEHSAEIARLLASPEFFADATRVLRVDSRTINDSVRRQLEEIERPHSPVRAVVSVDMLKEGWDVKNIAVMCTLRAMASDVLTQQTMGRGLRLPYGSYTDEPAVNQLDIISHQSFRSMLNDENILRTFGLESATRSGTTPQVGQFDPSTGVVTCPDPPIPGGNADHTNNDDAGTEGHEDRHPSGPISDAEAERDGTSSGPVIVNLGEGIVDQPAQQVLEVEINPAYAGTTFLFPTTRIERIKEDFKLSKIGEETLRAAARRVSGSGVVIHREEIRARVAKRLLATHRIMQAEGEAAPMASAEIEESLVDVVACYQPVPRTQANLTIARAETVPRFMSHVDVEWTEKSLTSAIKELVDLLAEEIKRVDRNRPMVTVIEPRRLPIREVQSYGVGARTYTFVDDRSEYANGRLYAPFVLSLFPAVRFDSYSGEYALAQLLETSNQVAWWKKLYPEDQARIAYTVRDNYYPDFVVFDRADDVYWIVEGKAAAGRHDLSVQAKRIATEELVRELLGHDDFVGQRWGYFIAYEDDIAASESWTDLKHRSATVGGRIS